jgi:hypothetical protein
LPLDEAFNPKTELAGRQKSRTVGWRLDGYYPANGSAGVGRDSLKAPAGVLPNPLPLCNYSAECTNMYLTQKLRTYACNLEPAAAYRLVGIAQAAKFFHRKPAMWKLPAG